MIANQVEIRRNTICCYLDEHDTVGMDDPSIIAKDLGMEVYTVKNDLKVIKAKYREENKKYNLEGIFKKHKKKADRLEQLQKETIEIGKNATKDSDKLNAIRLEVEIINEQYHLQTDGLTPIAEELESRESTDSKNNEVDNKSN